MQTIQLQDESFIVAAIVVLALGKWLTRRLPALSNYNIPLAVSGGLAFSVFFLLLYQVFSIRVTFDLALRDTLLMAFFSTIGLSAKLRVLAAGGKTLVALLLFAILLLIVQDVVGVLVALAMDRPAAYGLFAGSISLAGGHGTAIAWGETLEQSGLPGAAALGIGVATFGLIVGGVIGGPIGGYLINKYQLSTGASATGDYVVATGDTEQVSPPDEPLEEIFGTFLMIGLALMIGYHINQWLGAKEILLPPFLTAMFAGIILTNLADVFSLKLQASAIDRTGEVCLHLFLAMSLMSVELWQLASVVGPLLIVICLQMVALTLIAVFLVFRFTGRDYDAAVIAAGFAGLGLGATPVAIANMQSLTGRFGASPKAFLVVPMVGAFFVDLSNAAVINTFLNLPLLQSGLSSVAP